MIPLACAADGVDVCVEKLDYCLLPPEWKQNKFKNVGSMWTGVDVCEYVIIKFGILIQSAHQFL